MPQKQVRYKQKYVFLDITNDEENKERTITIADNLRQKGEQRGMERGKKKAIETMLKRRFDSEIVDEVTGLDIW
ncbi:MAG: hypothetical protein EOP34_11620 [Rickettsiales bacterium]|nr:MAG: hypothetical protein EOP34_11620 [Rickettsiales bacterium]